MPTFWRPNRLVLANGQRIHGRQAFPEIFVSRGVGRRFAGTRSPTPRRSSPRGEARSLVLKDAYSVSVRTELDVLRLDVVQRMRQEAGHV